MPAEVTFSVDIAPDWRGFRECIERRATPERVYFIELFLDPEVKTAICERFGLVDALDPGDPFFEQKRELALQRFLGYDYVRVGLDDIDLPLNQMVADDTAGLKRERGRSYVDEHQGPISNWEEFEAYPWPDPQSTRSLEWYEANLPEDMCIIGRGLGHFLEHLTWLMGFETLCYSLYEQRDLVAAIGDRLAEMNRTIVERLLTFDRVEMIWASDDMGFRTATLLSPDDLREFVLPGHRLIAQMAHEAGRLYLLHSCGNINAIMEDLIEDVGIDAKHSFEDTIESVVSAKGLYGDRIALLGGIDVDFLCRATEDEIRHRVRYTLENCIHGGGYCLGTGNSVANYIPLDNYLTMLDEGRRLEV
jgi:uroporphyrinogen decarboxylase